MADVTKIELGSCQVTYKGRDLGHTIGGVTVTYQPEYHETNVDKYGSSVAEKFLVGEKLMAEFELAEYTLANLQDAIPEGTLDGDDAIQIGSVAGKKASENAGMLVLHPLANAASDRNDDFTIYKGIITNEIKIEHRNDGERLIPVTVEAIVDEGRSDGNLLGFFGDSLA